MPSRASGHDAERARRRVPAGGTGPAAGYNRGVDRRVERRELLGVMASGMVAFVAACTTSDLSGGETTIVNDPALGTVYRWEKDDLLILVSGLKTSYRVGEDIRFEALLQNQHSIPLDGRLRTKLIGRGQQVVLEAEMLPIAVEAEGVLNVQRVLQIPRSMPTGDYYVLQIELPPWQYDGQTAGGGALTVSLSITS